MKINAAFFAILLSLAFSSQAKPVGLILFEDGSTDFVEKLVPVKEGATSFVSVMGRRYVDAAGHPRYKELYIPLEKIRSIAPVKNPLDLIYPEYHKKSEKGIYAYHAISLSGDIYEIHGEYFDLLNYVDGTYYVVASSKSPKSTFSTLMYLTPDNELKNTRHSDIASILVNDPEVVGVAWDEAKPLRDARKAQADKLREEQAEQQRLAEERHQLVLEQQRLNAINADIQRQQDEKNAELLRKKHLAEVKNFRLRLKVGDESNCGPVLEIKNQLAKIYSPVLNYGNEHWIRISQLFPSGYNCWFLNGGYVPPRIE